MISVAIAISLASTIFAPVLGQTVNVTSCFTTGVVGASSCEGFVDTFCGNSNAAGVVVDIGNSVSSCFNAASGLGFKCDFTAWRGSGPKNDPPNLTNCEATLNAVIEECPMGGEGNAGGGFTFTLDPNVGSCGPDVVSDGS